MREPCFTGASLGPSPALLPNMLDAANESAKLVTSQRDNLAMQLHGACRRIDELEARMAENASQTSNFIGQSAQEAKAMMQHPANTNEELRYKLTHHEQEAQELRRQICTHGAPHHRRTPASSAQLCAS